MPSEVVFISKFQGSKCATSAWYSPTYQLYAKCLQRETLYNYYKMDENCQPVEVEAINFLNAIPHISFTEDDHSKPGDRIEIEVGLLLFTTHDF